MLFRQRLLGIPLALFFLSSAAAADQPVGGPLPPPATAVKAPDEPQRSAERRVRPGAFAPSISGLTGLVRVVSTDVGSPHTFRVGLHTEALA